MLRPPAHLHHQHLEATMRSFHAGCLLATLAALAAAQCGKHAAVPVNPEVIGKKIYNSAGCSPGGQTSNSALKIEPWGIFWQPLHSGRYHYPYSPSQPVCPEEIVSLFARKDVPSVLLWRPAANAKAFEKSHPAQYALFLKDGSGKFPCAAVPVQKVPVWGPSRPMFKSLVAKMVKGILESRGQPSCRFVKGPPPSSLEDVKIILASHLVANNALTYLYNLAYSNFFCV